MSKKTYNNNFTEIFPDDKLFVNKQTTIRGKVYVKNFIDFTSDKTSYIILRKDGKIYRINANILYYLGNVDYCINSKFNELDKKIEYNNKCNKYNLNKINNLKRKIKCLKKQMSNKADKPIIALIKGILVFINNFCAVKNIFISRIIIFLKFITLITKIIFKK